MKIRRIGLLVLTGIVSVSGSAVRADQGEVIVVEDGRSVSIEYTLMLEDGSTADSNVGAEPLVYRQGSSQILPALERALLGLKVDDTKQVTLPPEKGYGVVDPDAFQKVEAQVIPEDGHKVGAQLVSEDEQGNRRLVRVHEIHDDWIILDLNHPLAGQTLRFEVKVVAIE